MITLICNHCSICVIISWIIILPNGKLNSNHLDNWRKKILKILHADVNLSHWKCWISQAWHIQKVFNKQVSGVHFQRPKCTRLARQVDCTSWLNVLWSGKFQHQPRKWIRSSRVNLACGSNVQQTVHLLRSMSSRLCWNCCHECKLQARVPETVAKQGSQEQVPKQRSQEQVSKKRLQKKVFKNRFASKGFPGKVPGNRFPSKVRKTRFARTGSQARVPRTVPQVPKQGFQEQVSLQGSKVTKQGPWEQVPKQGFHEQASFERTGSQARVRRTGSQEQVRVPRTNSLGPLGRFRAIGCQHSSHEQVPKHGFRLLMFPGTAFQEQLAKRNLEEHLQARLEARTESQVRFRRTGS